MTAQFLQELLGSGYERSLSYREPEFSAAVREALLQRARRERARQAPGPALLAEVNDAG